MEQELFTVPYEVFHFRCCYVGCLNEVKPCLDDIEQWIEQWRDEVSDWLSFRIVEAGDRIGVLSYRQMMAADERDLYHGTLCPEHADLFRKGIDICCESECNVLHVLEKADPELFDKRRMRKENHAN